MPSLVEIGPVAMEKKISKFLNVLLVFCKYLSLEKSMALHFNKFESPSSGSWEDENVKSLQKTGMGLNFYKINFNSSKDAPWIEHDTSF